MLLTRTIRQLELAITLEDAEAIYQIIALLIEQIGDEATSAIADALLAEHRRGYEPTQRLAIFAQLHHRGSEAGQRSGQPPHPEDTTTETVRPDRGRTVGQARSYGNAVLDLRIYGASMAR
jgi:hypothetical protein